MKLNKSYWLKKTPIITSLAILSLFSCKKEVTKVEITENNKKVNNSISFELPGKRGTNTHHRKGPIVPFENSYLPIPEGFSGTTFSLKHDYPLMGSVETPETYPWKAVTKSATITQNNALAYVEALKKYITTDMKKLLYDYDNWKPNEESWYQSIWLGSVREPIHGMYVGSNFNPGTLGSTQKDSLTTYVYTLYDKTAAQTLNNIWGTDSINAYNPNLKNAKKMQYAEGSVIVKFAFVNYNNSTNNWSPLNGSAAWEVNTDVLAGFTIAKKGATPKTQNLKLMQCDIIVKDSQASPKTNWVFSTLVYDKDAKGKDAWDKMIPLGATWGNNPEKVAAITKTKALTDAKVPAPIDPTLTENWINPKAPKYAIQTLGWGGRLSGPNDGAVFNTGPITTSTSGKTFRHGGVSTVGCLGCHSSAQYKFTSYLIPIVFPTTNGNIGTPLVYEPGSINWNRWFRNNNGYTPFDIGNTSLDYDMVTAFKAIPLWEQATGRKHI